MRTSADTAELNLAAVRDGLAQIADYVAKLADVRYFLIFGGGEPFLRGDFPEILADAASLLGAKNIGVNTNGTVTAPEDLLQVAPHLGVIEVSLDGFEPYHNAWRAPGNTALVANPFQVTTALIRGSTAHQALRDKIEVSCVLTRDNAADLKNFVEFVASLGVQRFSIHRAMPVGRMAGQMASILSASDYARVAVVLNEIYEQGAQCYYYDLHLHHSLESVFSVAFLGEDIHHSELLMRCKRHSIGIDPFGGVYFDPWCMVKPYSELRAGLIHDRSKSLSELLQSKDSLIRMADDINALSFRCDRCRMACSGGMRFNALGQYVESLRRSPTLSDLLAGLKKQDPACPFAD
jgi:MoaA/NifB/PqqE/SkfB family radical SAM enzyme